MSWVRKICSANENFKFNEYLQMYLYYCPQRIRNPHIKNEIETLFLMKYEQNSYELYQLTLIHLLYV
jgi:hypothetical protein